jgi:hypothetical protein
VINTSVEMDFKLKNAFETLNPVYNNKNLYNKSQEFFTEKHLNTEGKNKYL